MSLAQTAQYRWFKCRIDNPEAYNGQCFYWLHADTKQSSWEEPNEPFWIWDAATGKADPIGLQFPRQAERTREEVLQLDPVAKWGGYDPRIHGDYDPNADYAKYHEARRHEEAAALNLSDTTFAPVPYQASMGFNRVSGSAQASSVGPERHSDAAKSGRQMNAYFDVDAAANAHDGRSLKAERQKQRFSREQVQAFRDARKEKQRRRHMGWLTS